MKQFDFSTDFYNIGSGFIDFSIRFRMEHTRENDYYNLNSLPYATYKAGKLRIYGVLRRF